MGLQVNNLPNSKFDSLQPMIINPFWIQKRKIDHANDLNLDLILDTISSNLNMIKSKIKSLFF
jgi:hypothetical protein